MGLLDNLFQSLDNTLKDIADGGLEKKLVEGVDALSQFAETAPEKLEQLAGAPKAALDTVADRVDGLGQTVEAVKQKTSSITLSVGEAISRE